MDDGLPYIVTVAEPAEDTLAVRYGFGHFVLRLACEVDVHRMIQQPAKAIVLQRTHDSQHLEIERNISMDDLACHELDKFSQLEAGQSVYSSAMAYDTILD